MRNLMENRHSFLKSKSGRCMRWIGKKFHVVIIILWEMYLYVFYLVEIYALKVYIKFIYDSKIKNDIIK